MILTDDDIRSVGAALEQDLTAPGALEALREAVEDCIEEARELVGVWFRDGVFSERFETPGQRMRLSQPGVLFDSLTVADDTGKVPFKVLSRSEQVVRLGRYGNGDVVAFYNAVVPPRVKRALLTAVAAAFKAEAAAEEAITNGGVQSMTLFDVGTLSFSKDGGGSQLPREARRTTLYDMLTSAFTEAVAGSVTYCEWEGDIP